MEISIGLPNAIGATSRSQIIDWARAAESAGFHSLGTIDRLVFDSYEPIVALSAAAAVTDRIRLVTDVLLGPLRQNPALIAKQVLSLDALAGGGRTTLGIALGGREDDYEVSHIDISTRSSWIEDALPRIRAIWDGDGDLESKVGPRPLNGGPTLLVGGYVEAALERAAKHAHGWTQGGATPDVFKQSADNLTDYWDRHDREGQPYKMALAYFSLGPDAQKNAEEDLGDYYAWLGDETKQQIVDSAAKDADTVKQYIAGFEGVGCDELVLFPASADPEQVSLLANAAGL